MSEGESMYVQHTHTHTKTTGWIKKEKNEITMVFYFEYTNIEVFLNQ
jgi:hypothetical protein